MIISINPKQRDEILESNFLLSFATKIHLQVAIQLVFQRIGPAVQKAHRSVDSKALFTHWIRDNTGRVVHIFTAATTRYHYLFIK